MPPPCTRQAPRVRSRSSLSANARGMPWRARSALVYQFCSGIVLLERRPAGLKLPEVEVARNANRQAAQQAQDPAEAQAGAHA